MLILELVLQIQQCELLSNDSAWNLHDIGDALIPDLMNVEDVKTVFTLDGLNSIITL